MPVQIPIFNYLLIQIQTGKKKTGYYHVMAILMMLAAS